MMMHSTAGNPMLSAALDCMSASRMFSPQDNRDSLKNPHSAD
jgi:hypothetical protein